jgi:CRP-like cAMP-binding protein
MLSSYMKSPVETFSVRIPDPNNPGKTRRIQLSREQLLALESGTAPVTTRFGLPSSPLFKDVDDKTLAELGRVGRRRTVVAGSTLTSQGEISDCVYIVIAGKVRSTAKDKAGRTWSFFDLGTSGAGDIAGECAITGDRRVRTITAVVDSTVLEVLREDLLTILHGSSQMAVNLATYMAEKVVRSGQRFVQFSGSFTAQKVAMVLLHQAEFDGLPVGTPGMVRISSPITHEDIASQVGTTRESVVAAMRQLGDAAQRHGRFYTVDIVKLKEFTEGAAA